jgi:hypothetical protein
MSQVVTPTWTDNVTVLALTTLALNAVSRTLIDWRTKWGGFVFVRVGRGGTTALTQGIPVLLRRTINNGGTEHVGGATPGFLTQLVAAAATTCTASGSPNNAGVTSLTVAATTSFAFGDVVFIDGSGGTGNSEWVRVARVTSSTVLLLDAPTIFAHNNVLDKPRNKADQFTAWLEGGATYELVIDYGASTTGESVTIEAFAQTLDSIAVT